MKMRMLFVVGLLLSTLVFGMSPALAGTVTWNTDTTGEWSEPANWNGGVVPAGDNNVVISGAGTATIRSAVSYTGTTTILANGTLKFDGAVLSPTAGASLWFDASSSGSVLNGGGGSATTGDKVTQWNNLGSSGGSVASTGGNGPTFGSDTINGKPVLNFGGSANNALASGSIYTNTGSTASAFIVMKHTMTPGGYPRSLSFSGPSNDRDWSSSTNWCLNNGGDDGSFNVERDSGGGMNFGTIPAIGTAYMSEVVFDGSSCNAYINGNLLGSNAYPNSPNFNIDRVAIGAGWGAGYALESGYTGSIAEILVYNSALTTEQRKATEAYLNAKWLGAGAGGDDLLPTTTAMTINAGGTLDLNSGTQSLVSIAGGGNITLGSGTLTVNSTADVAYAGPISGTSGNLVFNGAHKLTLTGTNSLTGSTTVNGGTLEGNSGSLPNAIALTAGANVTFAQATDGVHGAAITGSGSFTKSDAGKLVLTGTNTYDGTTSVTGGILEGNTASIPTAVALSNNANVTFNQAADATYDKGITGAGSFTKTGAGRLALAGTNSYSGATTVSEGTLDATMASIPTAVTVASGATIAIREEGTATLTTAISGAGNFTKAGTGALTVTAAGYAGSTTVEAGKLLLSGGNNILPVASGLTVQADATLDATNLNQTVTSLSGAGTVAMGNGVLTVNSTGDSAFSGAISGVGGSLVKTGAGKLSLSGANTYDGATTVSQGTLEAAQNSLLSTPITVASGATMAINENNSSTLTKTISGEGNFAKTGSGELIMNTTPAYTGSTTVGSGTLRLQGAVTAAPTGAIAWLDASTLTGLNNGDAVTSAANLGSLGGGFVVNEIADFVNPTYNATGLNGKATINFNGAAGLKTTADLGFSGNTNSATMFAVLSRNTASGGAAVQLGSCPPGLNYHMLNIYSGPDGLWNPSVYGQGPVYTDAQPADTFQLLDFVHKHGAPTATAGTNWGYVNGRLIGTTVHPTDTSVDPGPLYVGTSTISNSSNSDVAEVLVYNTALSDAQHRQIESYLNYKWMGVGTTTNVLQAAASVTINAGATLAIDDLQQTVGGLSGSGNVALTNSTLTVNGTADAAFAGAITGNGSLVKAGDNKLALTGASSFTGTTTVNAGTLEINSASIPTAVTLANNATVAFNQTTSGTYSKAVSGEGTFAKTGDGVLTLTEASSYVGATAISGGTLRLLAAPTTVPTGSVLWLDASNLGLGNGAAVTTLADLSAAGNNAVAANASNAPSYSPNSLNGLGTIHFAGGDQGLITVNNIGISDGQSRSIFSVMKRDDGGTMIVAMGEEDFYKGYGLITNNDLTMLPYTWGQGGVQVGPRPAGVFEVYSSTNVHEDLGGGASRGTHAGYINGVLVGTNANQDDVTTTDRPVQIGYRLPEHENEAVSSNGSLGELLIYNSALSDAQRQQVEAYLGHKWLGTGATSNILPTNTAVTIAAGSALDLNGAPQMIGSLAGEGNVMLGNGTLTVNSTADSSFAGVISGDGGSLVKAGGNTLTLTGASTYSGTTTVTGGTLQGNTATLPLAVTVEANAVVKFDQAFDGRTKSVISGAGSIAKTGDGVLTIAGASTYSGETRVSGGTLRMGQTLLTDNPVAGSTLWLDASTLTLNNGDAVATLNDRSGNANNANATNWGGSITYTAAGLNGKGIIHISGTEALQTVNDLNITGDASRSVFVVMGRDTAGRISIQAGKDWGNDFGLDNNSANLNYFRWNDGPDVGVGLRPDTMEVYGMTHDSANQDTIVYANGAAVGTINSTLHTDNAPVRIGAFTNQGWCSENGSFAEALIYDRVLSEEERDQVEAYLNYKWFGIAPVVPSLPTATAVTVDVGSALDINSTQQTIGSLAGDGNVTLGAGTLTVASTADSTFAGSISGDGTLVKDGASTLVLSGVNSNQGGMVVNNGTLQIDSADALASDGGVVVGENGTVVLSSSIGKAVKIRRLTMLVGSGSSQGGLSAAASNSAPVAPVPEPSTIVLLAAGAMALAVAGLRRRNRARN